jgi:glyoxylase-like metal-dependent hydrolase (beta-lactamase superfamily II)
VLATHGHFDHIGSAAAFCGDELPLFIHEGDMQALSDSVAWGAGYETPALPVKDVRTMGDGDILRFAGFASRWSTHPAIHPAAYTGPTAGWSL